MTIKKSTGGPFSELSKCHAAFGVVAAVSSSPLHRLVMDGTLAQNLRGGVYIKDGVSQSVVMIEGPDDHPIFCKWYKENSVFQVLRKIIVGARAKWAHRRSVQFADLGLLTPASYGYAEITDAAIGRGSWHFMRGEPGGVTLARIFEYEKPDPGTRKNVLDELASSMARLHQAHCVHGDAKLSNLMWLNDRIMFIDLDGFSRSGFRKSYEREMARLLLGLYESSLAMQELLDFFYLYIRLRALPLRQTAVSVMAQIESLERKHSKKYQGKRRSGLHVAFVKEVEKLAND